MIAETWANTRLKNLVEPIQTGVWGADPTGDEDDILCVRVADFDRQRFGLKPVETVRSVPEKEQSARLLRAGDILLEKSGGTEVNPVGFTVMFEGDYPAVSSNFIGRVRMRQGQHPRFWLYALAASYFTRRTQKCVRQTTGIQNLDQAAFLDENFLVPPLEEQRIIASYLDRETARIDTILEEQQRLIEMLRERRRSVVKRAVGGSGQGNVRQTNDPWWPALPNNWAPVSLRRVLQGLADGPHFSPNYVDDGVTFISARNIKVDGWSLDDAKFISAEDYKEFSKRVVPKPGDVLYTKGGTTGVARAVDMNFPFQVWVHVAVLKLRRGLVDPYFLAYALNSEPCYDQAQLYTRGATNNDLGLGRIVNIVVPLPPVDEQQKIVAYLDAETEKINALIMETERFIGLARERRSALVAAAVRGQIDVRTAA